MDAIMGAGSAMCSSLLNGLDIVAMTSENDNKASIPSSAQYGVIIGIATILLLFPVCFKAGVLGQVSIYGFGASGNALGISARTITLSQDTYDTHDYSVTIIWFG